MKSHGDMIEFAQEALRLSKDIAVELVPFEGRGSDRAYFRFRWDGGNSVILVHYQTERIENAYYADIALFLMKNGIPVPQILRHDRAGCRIVMKDLGDTDLWSLRHSSWEQRRGLYQKTLSVVHRLHSFPERLFPAEGVKLMEAFGPSLYRWERNYFKENFVRNLCGIELQTDLEQGLETELSGLSEGLAHGGRSLVHRDLQSQNVMIYHDEPYLIDFQGMRFGSRFYDLGSLLCDPYVVFTVEERKELLSFYYGLSKPEMDWSRFQNAFWEASAQRLMQALGAYGFLGLTKGLRNYLVHVPGALQNLRSAAEHAGSLPKLLETCIECERALKNSKSGIGNMEAFSG